MTYHRKQPRPLDVIASLLHQGIEIRCYRTKELVTLANYKDLEREHLVELGLLQTDEDKARVDTPEYWRWSFSEAHAKVTNGTKATSAGSSKQRVAKAKRMEMARLRAAFAGDFPNTWGDRKRAWPSRSMRDPRYKQKFNGKTIRRQP